MSDVGNVVLITTGGDIKICDLNWNFNEKRKLINASCLEIVKTDIMRDLFSDFVFPGCVVAMMVDESGALKDLPVNLIASSLYGSELHGNYIFGDVFLFELDYFGSDYPLSHPDVVAALTTHFDLPF